MIVFLFMMSQMGVFYHIKAIAVYTVLSKSDTCSVFPLHFNRTVSCNHAGTVRNHHRFSDLGVDAAGEQT